MPKNKSFGALVKEYGFQTRRDRFEITGKGGRKNRAAVADALRYVINRDGFVYRKDLTRSMNVAFAGLAEVGEGDTGPLMSNPNFRRMRTEKSLNEILDVAVRSADDIHKTTLGEALVKAFKIDRRRQYEVRRGQPDSILYYIDWDPVQKYMVNEFSHVPTFVKRSGIIVKQSS